MIYGEVATVGNIVISSWSSKKPILAKGSRPERQGKKRLLNMKEKGEVLDKLDAGMGPVGVGNNHHKLPQNMCSTTCLL